eukprot:CAMPEP_0116885118 /NCGR_PEP_ID=MMETSP0463-20121206/18329_1 /TAXON_ID=181622 /ORGANISM="Strombidinopsis sp, Strain SopsisLIS2011" /LENGTH=57 /DNA_ID=CAMNT_0004542941 /DNA_START=31 /DNA_END=204 /DNA_ORIENTATION=+
MMERKRATSDGIDDNDRSNNDGLDNGGGNHASSQFSALYTRAPSKRRQRRAMAYAGA